MDVRSSDSYTVTLLYWPNAPAPSDSGRPRIFRSGHIALEIKKNGLTVDYLGWWPQSYSVQRTNAHRSFLQKLLDRLSLWFTRVDGRLSSYGIVQDALNAQTDNPNAQVNPDAIDSVLVRNAPFAKMPNKIETVEDWKGCEKLPENMCLAILEQDAEEVRKFIQNFRIGVRNNQIKYQFFLNNCATVIAEALKSGGHNTSYGWIPWWPSRLKSRIKHIEPAL